MTAILFALTSYFTWGTGVLLEAIVARRLSSYSLLFWSFLLSFLVSSLYLPFEFSNLFKFSFPLLILNIALALFGFVFGTVFYYEALKRTNPVLVGTITSSFPFVTVISSVVFLGGKSDP